ncbi:MAG TPA: hypothetical protein VJ829_02070 [Candidatus Binatia bacterium]|nr:hypothetical protein [Candidatus Binatia bacterium]
MRLLLLFLTCLLLAAPSHGAGRPVGVTTITFTKTSVTSTFRVGVCLDQADAALPLCTATGSSGYQVRKPVPTSKDPVDKANAVALVNALKALGGTATGTKQNDIHFTVPLAAPTCTALASIDVPLKHGKATSKSLRGCGELGKCVDTDKLKLRCLPAS